MTKEDAATDGPTDVSTDGPSGKPTPRMDLNLTDRKQVAANAAKRVKELLAEGERSGAVKSLKRLRAAAGFTTALTFATVASGAFVAGNR